MIIHALGSSPPNIPQLQWNYAATEMWIGRLPLPGTNPAALNPQK
jgi:hypothetical protein